MLSDNLYKGSRITLLTRLICFFWLVAKLISWKLWLADRLFPIVPVFGLFVPSVIHLILFILSLSALLALFIYPANRTIQISIIVIEILSCLLDQNRWQPWEFQYFFMLLVFIINRQREKDIFSILGFILAAMYFYSGLSKINPIFLNAVWYQLVLTHFLHVSYTTAHQPLVYHAGYLIGLTEIILSVGLFFKRTKKTACIFIIAMHLLILLTFGPLGLNYDIIIWPWNIALIILVFILILKNDGFTISFKPLLTGTNKLIFLLFGIMPILNFFGYWEFFFSSSLFSGRQSDMYICIKKTPANKALQAFSMPNNTIPLCDSNSFVIYIRDWAFKEMITPENPEMRIYKSIKGQLEKRYPGLDATFITYTYRNGKRIKEELK